MLELMVLVNSKLNGPRVTPFRARRPDSSPEVTWSSGRGTLLKHEVNTSHQPSPPHHTPTLPASRCRSTHYLVKYFVPACFVHRSCWGCANASANDGCKHSPIHLSLTEKPLTFIPTATMPVRMRMRMRWTAYAGVCDEAVFFFDIATTSLLPQSCAC